MLERSLVPSSPIKALLDPNAVLFSKRSIRDNLDRGVYLPMGPGIPEAIDQAIHLICAVTLVLENKRDDEFDVEGGLRELFGLVERIESGAGVQWWRVP
jgi:hypothetical protein